MRTNDVTREVIGGCMAVHRALGPGLLESSYEACVAVELSRRGLSFDRQLAMPLSYEGVVIEAAYRIDFLVERRVVVELKCVIRIEPVHVAQVLTYLKISGCRVGLLINFNVALLKDGIRRLILSERSPLRASAYLPGSAVGE